MNSYPLIESMAEKREDVMSAVMVLTLDEDDDFQQVDSMRIARISRAQARREGALSETPRRIGDGT